MFAKFSTQTQVHLYCQDVFQILFLKISIHSLKQKTETVTAAQISDLHYFSMYFERSLSIETIVCVSIRHNVILFWHCDIGETPDVIAYGDNN